MKEYFKIKGMGCEHCERVVKDALELLGVSVVKISHEEGVAEIDNVDGISKKQIEEAIAQEGYTIL